MTPFRSLGALVALALAAAATPAAANSVKGRVLHGSEPVADAVVLVGGPTIVAAADAKHAVMDQKGKAFLPHVLAVQVGTTVDFPNRDPFLHNVSGYSSAKTFNLGMYGQGEARSVTFDKAGVVPIRCNVHPEMGAFIIVHQNPYFAVTDAHGNYVVDDVPAGKYRVHVWHEKLAEGEAPVAVYDGQVSPLDVHLEARR
jgi:plastocyanin